jgi:phosphate transport system ATP-binding protein
MIATNQQHIKSETYSFPEMKEISPLKKIISSQSIKIENLDVYIEDQHILKDINLTIPERNITCIIGPSGCGKSTFLKTLNRMHDESPEVKISGKVYVDDENIYDSQVNVIDTRKKMGLLAQRPCPLPMSIFDNVAYGPRIHGMKKRKAINQTVIQYLQYVGLWDEVRDRVRTSATRLSIGQQQRLCLARGLAIEPEYILGDEATSALDPLSTKKIEELFVKLKEKYTIILVTHTLRQARRIADNIIFMYLGKIIEAGPTGISIGKFQLIIQYNFVENKKTKLYDNRRVKTSVKWIID